MRLTRIFLALIFCVTLFASCSVDELEDDTPQTKIGNVQATGDDYTPPPPPPPGNGDE